MNTNTDISSSVSVLTVLQLIIGAIVVLGGVALVFFSIDVTGKLLGVVHATLGVAGLSAGFLLLSKKRIAWAFSLWTDSLIIAFSVGSEVVLSVTGSLPSAQYIDSIVGTLGAVLIGIVVIVFLARSDLKTFLRKDHTRRGQIQ